MAGERQCGGGGTQRPNSEDEGARGTAGRLWPRRWPSGTAAHRPLQRGWSRAHGTSGI